MKSFFKIVFAFVVFTSLSSVSIKKQENDNGGIQFKHISFEEAKKAAEKSGKIIFIDAYTSWCGPCKRMAATTFKDAKVGEYFNENFINLKIDCEKDADGIEISKMYRVQAYPTLLFINGKGKLIKSSIGFQEPAQLLATAKSVN